MKMLIVLLSIAVCIESYVLYKFNGWMRRLLVVADKYKKLLDDICESIREDLHNGRK